MGRRALLASAAMTTVVPLGGCLGDADDADPDSDAHDAEADTDAGADANDQYDFPGDCPTSHDLGVERPSELDADSAASFVVAYEERYLEEIVVGEPESQVEQLVYGVGYRPPVEEVDDGYLIEVGGGGAHYTPHLHLNAAVADAPEGATRVPIGDVDDESLSALLEDAAAEGEAGNRVGPGSAVDDYINSVAALSPDFEPLSGPGASGTAYFEVNDVSVELTLETDSFHGDMGWEAVYFVDHYVLWRGTTDVDTPRDGELMECRTPD